MITKVFQLTMTNPGQLKKCTSLHTIIEIRKQGCLLRPGIPDSVGTKVAPNKLNAGSVLQAWHQEAAENKLQMRVPPTKDGQHEGRSARDVEQEVRASMIAMWIQAYFGR